MDSGICSQKFSGLKFITLSFDKKDMKKLLIIACFAMAFTELFSQPLYYIDCHFPGGNIDIDRITEDSVWLKPDVRDTEGSWFYYNFKVKNANNQRLTFVFNRKNIFSADGSAYTKDQGETWHWLGGQNVTENSFQFDFNKDDSCIQFCTAIPYTEKDFDAFIKRNFSEFMVVSDLCTTRYGRSVERLMLANPIEEARYKVLLTARHHACEMMASYVLEGIIDAVLNDDEFQYLRMNVDFMVVPFMDKDGVETGDQGKNRTPRDHNRDYSGMSIYQTTMALRDQVPDWSEGRLKIALDIHCPYIKGEWNEQIYLVGAADKENATQEKVFCEILENSVRGELPYHVETGYLGHGKAWNTGGNTMKGSSFKNWAVSVPGMAMATTMEFPYSRVQNKTVTRENARAFGVDIARAMQTYLMSLKLHTKD